MAVTGFIVVVVIVLCVYLKEHFKISLFRSGNEGTQMAENGQYDEMNDDEDVSIKGSPYYERSHSNLKVSKTLD